MFLAVSGRNAGRWHRGVRQDLHAPTATRQTRQHPVRAVQGSWLGGTSTPSEGQLAAFTLDTRKAKSMPVKGTLSTSWYHMSPSACRPGTLSAILQLCCSGIATGPAALPLQPAALSRFAGVASAAMLIARWQQIEAGGTRHLAVLADTAVDDH